MGLHSELQRIWSESVDAVALIPAGKVFTSRAPDAYFDDNTDEILPNNVPFMVIGSPDTALNGGTSRSIGHEITVAVTVYHSRRDLAEQTRDFARDLFENQTLDLQSATSKFQNISIDAAGESTETDGIYEFFQNFIVQTTIIRPTR